ncbi:MAG: NINE protein [Bacilli bacterium]
MYCYHCGQQLEDDATICINCGTDVTTRHVEKVKKHKEEHVNVDVESSSSRSNKFRDEYSSSRGVVEANRKSIMLAGILNLFLPGVGRLYLGYIGLGLGQLLTSGMYIGAIWSFVDGILMLTGSVKVDGQGNPVK